MGDLSEHFSRHEFACKDRCGRDTIDAETLRVIEDVREHFGKVIRIASGFRCVKHNQFVGGEPNSQHLYGRAADIMIMEVPPKEVQAYLHGKYPNKYGIGSYFTFTHIDTRTGGAARWNG